MSQNSILNEATMYCRKTGLALSTLAVRVLGNSRYFDRLQRRVAKEESDAQKLREFMRANPPASEHPQNEDAA